MVALDSGETPLASPDRAALEELENRLGEIIPKCSSGGRMDFGYSQTSARVTGLALVNKELGALPETIGNLTALRELKVTGGFFRNGLTDLPETIGNLTALQILALKGNKLETLPETIGNLAALKELNLHGNQLTALPEAIGDLTSLEKLDLHYNQLVFLPGTIGNLAALQILDLKRNKLTTLPETIGRLSALTRLNLESNLLSALPGTFAQLTALEEANLGKNQLVALPSDIGRLTALRELDVSENRLIALPETIGRLNALTHLNLGSNNLSALPPTFDQLAALRFLDLSYNHELSTLPGPIKRLSSLRELKLYYKSSVRFPGELAGEFQELQDRGVKVHYLHGVLLKTLVGGTFDLELFKRKINPDSSFVESHVPSIGMDFCIKDVIVGNFRCRLQLFFLSYPARHKFQDLYPDYMKGAMGALFLFDLQEASSLDGLGGWMKLIRAEDAEMPVLVVGTGGGLLDDERGEAFQRAIEKELAAHSLPPYLPVNFQTMANVQEMVEQIAMKIMEKRFVGD